MQEEVPEPQATDMLQVPCWCRKCSAGLVGQIFRRAHAWPAGGATPVLQDCAMRQRQLLRCSSLAHSQVQGGLVVERYASCQGSSWRLGACCRSTAPLQVCGGCRLIGAG